MLVRNIAKDLAPVWTAIFDMNILGLVRNQVLVISQDVNLEMVMMHVVDCDITNVFGIITLEDVFLPGVPES